MFKLVKLATFAGIVALVGCGGGLKVLKADLDATKEKKAKLAIVSLTVSDYGSLQWMSSKYIETLVATRLDQLLAFSEEAFARAGWTVVPTAQVVSTPVYKQASINKLFERIYRPRPGGQEMLSFSQSHKDLVKARLDPQAAAELCAGLGVDLVVLIFSEWATDSQGFTGLTSPLAKNVVGVFNSQGRQVFQGRQDEKGNTIPGAFGYAVVDATTLDGWVGAFQKGLTTLIATM